MHIFSSSLRSLIFYCITLSFYLIAVSCQPTSQSKEMDTYPIASVDSLLQAFYMQNEFNGTILVADSNGIIYEAAWGTANVQQKDTLSINSVFYLGSIAKQFTAMAILMLKNEQKLAYDTSILTYFPQLSPIFQPVTVRHLLTHTSGIPDYYSEDAFTPGFTNQDVWDFLQNIDSLAFEPGSQYAYSNTAYVLLSILVERVSGTTFSTFLDSCVFKPLSMRNTVVYDTTRPDIPLRVTGHTSSGVMDDYNAFTTGGGGIFSNLPDLYKWERALYTDKLIPQTVLQEAYKPYTLSDGTLSYYGFGWMINNENSHQVYHSGSLAGFRTYMWRDRNCQTTIIILSNYTNSVASICEAVQKVYLGETGD